MFRCGKTLIALALLIGDPCRRVGPNRRQAAGPGSPGATGEPAAADCRAV